MTTPRRLVTKLIQMTAAHQRSSTTTLRVTAPVKQKVLRQVWSPSLQYVSDLFIDMVAKPAAASGSQGSDNNPQPIMAAEASPDSSGESGKRGRSRDAGCRKERHNLMERKRR